MAVAQALDEEFTPRLIELLQTHWQATQGGLGPPTSKGCYEMLNQRRAGEALDLLQANVPFPLANRRVLEIGCGAGANQLAAHRREIGAVGVEPSTFGVRTARQLLNEKGFPQALIFQGVGEYLPFGSSEFDVVCSFQVIEHVSDPAAVISETVRVLRPGGYFVHVFPNYGSFWEGHYGVPWVPHLPKALGRLYIKALRQDIAMMDELQLLSHGSLTRLLNRHDNVRIVNWGLDLWEHRVRTLDFSEWGSLKTLKRFTSVLHQLHIVGLAISIGRVLHFETPFVLVGEKINVTLSSPAHEHR